MLTVTLRAARQFGADDADRRWMDMDPLLILLVELFPQRQVLGFAVDDDELEWRLSGHAETRDQQSVVIPGFA